MPLATHWRDIQYPSTDPSKQPFAHRNSLAGDACYKGTGHLSGNTHTVAPTKCQKRRRQKTNRVDTQPWIGGKAHQNNMDKYDHPMESKVGGSSNTLSGGTAVCSRKIDFSVFLFLLRNKGRAGASSASSFAGNQEVLVLCFCKLDEFAHHQKVWTNESKVLVVTQCGQH